MHLLFVLRLLELCIAIGIVIVLMWWPTSVCREITDTELEEAYVEDEQCAEELDKYLQLIRNDTITELFQPSDIFINNSNIRQNIWRTFYFQKYGKNIICIKFDFRTRFGIVNEQLGSAHLLIPIVGAITAVFFLLAQIAEFIYNEGEITVKVQALCGIIYWLITSLSLSIIGSKWNSSDEFSMRNLGAPFPLEWEVCKFAAWFCVCFKILEIFLADGLQTAVIKFAKPLTLTVVEFPTSYRLLALNTGDCDTMDLNVSYV